MSDELNKIRFYLEQVGNIMESLEDNESSKYTFKQIRVYMEMGLTYEAIAVKAYLDESGLQRPTDISESLGIGLLRIYGTLGLLDELGLLPEGMTLPGSLNGEIHPSIDHCGDIPTPEENNPTEDDDEQIVYLDKREVTRKLSNEECLTLLWMAYMRYGEWPTYGKGWWSPKCSAICEELGMPFPRTYVRRFGSMDEARKLAEEQALWSLGSEDFESDSHIELVDDELIRGDSTMTDMES